MEKSELVNQTPTHMSNALKDYCLLPKKKGEAR